MHREDHGIPLLNKYLILDMVVTIAPIVPINKDVNPSMDWINNYISKMDTHGGKSFACFSRKLIDTFLTNQYYE